MPTVTTIYDFDDFVSDSSGGGVAWTNPNNAIAADGSYATVDLNGTNPTSQLLVGTIANGGSGITLPEKAVITNIRVLIKGWYFSGGIAQAEIHEIWPWDGTNDEVPLTSRNQAGDYDPTFSVDTGR